MKNVLTLFTLFSLFGSTHLLAQNNIDTIRVDLGKNRSVILISDDLNVFGKLSIDSIIREVRKQYGGTFANPGDTTSIQAFYISDSGTVERFIDSTGRIKVRHPQGIYRTTSSVVLSVGIGIGVVKNGIAPFASVGIGYSGRSGYGVMLSVTPYFFFSNDGEKSSVLQNTFLDASFFVSTNNISTINIGAGYLIQRNGNYYDKNTSRIFLAFDPLGTYRRSASIFGITIVPELIISGFFKKAYPGVGIRFLF